MNKLILTLVLLSSSAMAQVPVQVCEDKPMNMPRGVVFQNGQAVNIPWNGPNSQIVRVCRIVMVPTQNTAPNPPTVVEQQQLQRLSQ